MSKSAAFGIAIPCEIRSKVTHLGGRGLVAIQATHGPLQQIQYAIHMKLSKDFDVK